MLVCVSCGHLFEAPAYWEETHGLDTPPYEKRSGCPVCYSGYVEARRCDSCGEFITDEYIKTEDGERFCQECYMIMALGEEDF